MAVSIQSGQKIKYLEEGLQLIRNSRRSLAEAMTDCRKVANDVSMAAVDRAYNGMVAISAGFNDLLDKTQTGYSSIAEALANRAGIVGGEFKTQINALVDEYASLAPGEVFTIKEESSGLEDNLTDTTRKQFDEAIEKVMQVRYNYIISLSEVTQGCMSDEDFRTVIIPLGTASEEFCNQTLVKTFTSIQEALEQMGIFMDKRLESMRSGAAVINQVEMSGAIPEIMAP